MAVLGLTLKHFITTETRSANFTETETNFTKKRKAERRVMSAVVSTSKEKKSKTKEKSTKDKRKEKKQNSIPDQISDSSDSDSEPVNGQTPATSNNSHVPPGAILLDNVLSAEEFDYDRLKDDDDLELCVIRLPNGVCYFYFSPSLSQKVLIYALI